MESNKVDWSKLKGPIVLEKKNWSDINEDYLFHSQMKQVKKLLEQFESGQKDRQDKISKNIAITGERGTGKTSMLLSLKNILEKDGYYVFDLIDPLVFNQDLNILEILISQIYSLISEDKSLRGQMEESIYINRASMHKKLKKITKVLSEKRQKEAYFKRNNPAVEILSDISDRTNLDKSIEELLKETKDFLDQDRNKYEKNNKKIRDFVLIIDDIDLLDNEKTYKFIEDIENYLDRQLIIIFAYREQQLEDSMFNELVNDNKNLLDRKIVENLELQTRIGNHLEKLIPYSNRVKLFRKDEILNMEIKNITREIGIYDIGEISVKDWIYDSIYKKTNLSIKPIDIREETSKFMPGSIRSLLQIIELLEDDMVNLETIDSLEEIDDEDKERKRRIRNIQNFKYNLKIFREYFKLNIYNELLEDRDFIESWFLLDSYHKNYRSYHYFYGKIEDKLGQGHEDFNSYPLNLYNYEAYNLALGDIYSILEYYKDKVSKDDKDFYLVYAMKVLYSIELWDKLMDCILDYSQGIDETTLTDYLKGELDSRNLEKMISFEKYLQLINTRIMPLDFNYYNYRSSNKNWENYTLKYGLMSEHPGYKELLDKVIISELSSSSDVREGIRKGLKPFKYRNLYSYLRPELTDTHGYNYEIYGFCGKATNLFSGIEKIMEEGLKDKVPYLFYNMFHIDMFTRLTYSSRGTSKYRFEKNYIKTALLKVDSFLVNNIRDVKENRHIADMLNYFGTYILGVEDPASEEKSLKTMYYQPLFLKIEENEDPNLESQAELLRKIVFKSNFEVDDFLEIWNKDRGFRVEMIEDGHLFGSDIVTINVKSFKDWYEKFDLENILKDKLEEEDRKKYEDMIKDIDKLEGEANTLSADYKLLVMKIYEKYDMEDLGIDKIVKLGKNSIDNVYNRWLKENE